MSIELEKLFLDGLSRVSKIAEEEKVKVLIEPEPGLLIENSKQFKKPSQELLILGMCVLTLTSGIFTV